MRNVYIVRYRPATNTRGSGHTVKNVGSERRATFVPFDYAAHDAALSAALKVDPRAEYVATDTNGDRFFIV